MLSAFLQESVRNVRIPEDARARRHRSLRPSTLFSEIVTPRARLSPGGFGPP